MRSSYGIAWALAMSSGALAARGRARAERRVRDVVERSLRRHVWGDPRVRDTLDRGLEAIARG